MPRRVVLAALAAVLGGCQVADLARYTLFRDDPRLAAGEEISISGLRAPVDVARRADGLWRIVAANEHDASLAVGYLQARDRMAQLDLFRHIARGELAALIGDRPFGDRSALDVDRMNRFLGFRDDARRLYRAASDEERRSLDAFAHGVNTWIETGPRSIEHRLLGVEEIRAWAASDSLSIYLMIMHALGGNWDREVRRLLIACAAGLDAVERIWPMAIEYAVNALPDEDLRAERYRTRPAVAPELASELAELCRQGAADAGAKPAEGGGRWQDVDPSTFSLGALTRLLSGGWAASNNWAVAGALTRSGKPILSNDPHLPHMNPPIVWGMELDVAGERAAGFTLPGLHRVVFGHNGRVAWGATTNFVDRQDLVVHRLRSETRDGQLVEGYDVEGEFIPFRVHTETFEVRGGATVHAAARFTRDGPLVNDIEPAVAKRIPITALRRADIGAGRDLDGAREMNRARNAAEFARGLAMLDLGCSSWLFADAGGTIAFRSPCRVPVRESWSGTFPVPGWLHRYEWTGYVAKDDLPATTSPRRGWLATANNQIVPPERFPTTYNADASAPNRFLRIRARLLEATGEGKIDAAAAAAIQLDVLHGPWRSLRASLETFCARASDRRTAEARRMLCEWDGDEGRDSRAATLWVLWSNALIDRALADELPGGAGGEILRYVQSLIQFEANAQFLWQRPANDPVWDDVRTPAVESRDDVLEQAFDDALKRGRETFGGDVDAWAWGEVRPFVLRHPFSSGGGVLGALFDSPPHAIGGDTESVFKQQFPRSDREHLHPAVGPVVRFTVDMADPWAATYSLAGGESGWPRSQFYGNLLDDWAAGRGRPLTPPPDTTDVGARLVPASSD